MNTDRDAFADAIEMWLEEGEAYEDPNRVLDGVIARLDTSPQLNVPWALGRFRVSQTLAGFAIAAVAVVAVAIVATSLLRAPDGLWGSGLVVSPSPLTTPTPTSNSSPTPTLSPLLNGPLAAGTYRLGEEMADSKLDAYLPALTFTIGDGWLGYNDSHAPPGIRKLHEADLVFFALTELDLGGDHGLSDYEMACGTYYSPGPMIKATLERVVASWAGTDGTIADVVIDGRAGKALTQLVDTASQIRCPGDPAGPPWDRTRTGVARWTDIAVEMDGSVVFIEYTHWADADPSVQAELDQIIDSIRFQQQPQPQRHWSRISIRIRLLMRPFDS